MLDMLPDRIILFNRSIAICTLFSEIIVATYDHIPYHLDHASLHRPEGYRP